MVTSMMLYRTFKRFAGLMVQLLHKYHITAADSSVKLIKVKTFVMSYRGGVKNPSHGNCPLGGYPPPPPGAITDDIFPKS